MSYKYATVVCTTPGWIWVGKYVNRDSLENRFPTLDEAITSAEQRASFGSPFSDKFAVLVLRRKPGKGWRILHQIQGEVWEDWEEDDLEDWEEDENEKMYMNPHTGSVSTQDEWRYKDDDGRDRDPVNENDGLIEVIWKECVGWIEA